MNVTRHKQCTELIPDQNTVIEIARGALRERLRNVRRLLARAVKSKCDCVEDTHQLRVATRRADAALRLFCNWLSGRRQRQMRDMLREIRASAGAVRDLDVFRERFVVASGSPALKSSKWLLNQLDTQRRSERKNLLGWRKKASRDRLRELSRTLVRSMRWRGMDDAPSSQQLASQTVGRLTSQFEETLNCIDSDPNQFHRARICGRRLRYTLELLGGVFPQEVVDTICRRLTEIQDELGRVNDDATALRHLRDWLAECNDDSVRRTLHVLVVRAESAVAARVASVSDVVPREAPEVIAQLRELNPLGVAM